MAISAYVLDSALGSNAAGDVINLDSDVAAALVDAGIIHEATADDLAPEADDAPEETLDETETSDEMKAEDEGEDDKEDDEDEKRRVRQIEEMVVKNVVAAMKKSDKGVKAANLSVPTNRHIGGSDFITTGGYKSFGHYLKDLYQAEEYSDWDAQKRLNKYKQAKRKNMADVLRQKDMSTIVSSAGGAFLPQTWAKELYALSFKNVPNLLAMHRQYQFENKQLNIPSSIQASGTSAVQAYWQTELQAMPETDQVSEDLVLTLNTLAVFTNMSDQLILFSSPYNLEQFYFSQAPGRLRYKLNDSIVNGGNGQTNLIGNAASVTVDRASSNAITLPDINNMWVGLYEDDRADAVWLVESEAVAQLYSLAFPNGSGTTPAFLPVGPNWTGGQGNISAPPMGTIYGKPVYQVENLAALGSTGDLILCNLDTHAAGFIDMGGESTGFLYWNKLEQSFRYVIFCASGNPRQLPYTRKNGSVCSNCVVLDSAT